MIGRYYGVYPATLTIEKVKELYNPYKFGYITELKALDGFEYNNAKVGKRLDPSSLLFVPSYKGCNCNLCQCSLHGRVQG